MKHSIVVGFTTAVCFVVGTIMGALGGVQAVYGGVCGLVLMLVVWA